MRGATGLTILFVLSSLSSAGASSCTADLAAAQVLLDKQENRTAAKGPRLPETKAAQQHRQPTPASIARAEASKAGNQSILLALKALESARKADQAGDEATCRSKLAEMRTLLGAH